MFGVASPSSSLLYDSQLESGTQDSKIGKQEKLKVARKLYNLFLLSTWVTA